MSTTVFRRCFRFLGVLAVIASTSVHASGFYFDGGFGVGGGSTKIGGNDVSELLQATGISETSVEFGIRAGYGPVADLPMYLVGEISGIGHRFEHSSEFIQYNSYLFGPGIIVYPIRLVQLGLSLGFSSIANNTNIPGVIMADGDGGFAWNISAAVDVGGEKHGCLIGVKYFGATNGLQTLNVDQKQSFVGVFVKYVFRTKGPTLF